MRLPDGIADDLTFLTDFRRDLHAHPELGFEEVRTSDLVAKWLEDAGLKVHRGLGKTGVVGTLQVGNGTRSIGLRADMDALAMPEIADRPYKSREAGKMHACGHDGHTTMLLGAARHLAKTRNFSGTVHFIFQPAEEGLGGARVMIEEGLFDRFNCDAVYGMHNMPGIAVGSFAMRAGPLMAASGRWTVAFRGTGGHGGNAPHLASDITVAQAVFIQALQTIVARNVAATESAVVSVGHIAGGAAEALNVMPSELLVGGTMRAFTAPVQALVERRIRELAEQSAAMVGATAEVTLWWNTVPLINAGRETEAMLAAARALVGEGRVDGDTTPVTGGEDFAYMTRAKPGALVFLGNGDAGDGPVHGLHTPDYDFNDAALPHGIGFWVGLVAEELGA